MDENQDRERVARSALHCEDYTLCGQMYSDYALRFDVPDVREALRVVLDAPNVFHHKDDRPLVAVDAVAMGEMVVGLTRGRVDVALVRRDDRGVDGEHLRELLRPHHVHHGASARPLLGCFSPASDVEDVHDLAALMVDAGGHSFFDYASSVAVPDLGFARRWRYDEATAKTWRTVGGDVVGEGYKYGHAWQSAAYVDLGPRGGRVLALRDFMYW
jgi:hypothetical protein